MAITTLDSKTALIVIDLQKGIVARASAHPIADVIKHACALVEAFRRHQLPVVLVNVAGGAPGRTDQPPPGGELPPGWTDLIGELNQQPEDYLVTKHTWGAFSNADLSAYLKNAGVTQVVIAGISTSIGVESTARQAHEHGFHVTLATDAMTDTNLDAHHNSVTRIFPRLGETGTTAEIIALLDKTRS